MLTNMQNNNAARNHKRVDAAIARNRGKDAELTETPIQEDPALKVFIDSKLKEWDKDKSGRFEPDEIQLACDEMRGVMEQLASLKWTIIICSVGLSCLLALVLGAGAIAIALVKETTVGNNGQLTKADDGAVIVTSEVQGVDDFEAVYNFDSGDNFGLTDHQMRDLDSISFSDSNGTFYHEKVAQLTRYDSGPGGETDQVGILTEAGHEIRFFEANEWGLEVKWADQPNSQWELLVVPLSRRLLDESTRRLLDASDGLVTSLEDFPELRDAPPDAPSRLLSKGHYVGGVYVHSRGGSGNNGRCDPSYIEGTHDPQYYCDTAQRFAGLSILCLLPILSSFTFLA